MYSSRLKVVHLAKDSLPSAQSFASSPYRPSGVEPVARPRTASGFSFRSFTYLCAAFLTTSSCVPIMSF